MERYYPELRVRLRTERMGDDLCVTVCGGDRPHIGSVAVAEPRESLRGGGRSATVSTINYPGHKDDAVANAVAHAAAARLGCRTVVLCGLHYDGADEALFTAVRDLTERMIEDVVRSEEREKEAGET